MSCRRKEEHGRKLRRNFGNRIIVEMLEEEERKQYQ
jgi:hypothetical protein